MSALVVRGDSLRLPLRDASVDLIICSPPYFALRSYRDGGEHFDGQIGSEPHPRDYLEALWSVMRECWRVLKPTGSCFVNLGDKRSGSGGHNNSGITTATHVAKECEGCGYVVARKTCPRCGGRMLWTPAGREAVRSSRLPEPTGSEGASAGHTHLTASRRNAPDRYTQAAYGRPKSKMLLPHRFAIGCEDGLADPDGIGWIVRQDIVWCLSGGTKVYARTPTGARPIMLRDLHRSYQPEDVQLWNGQKWTQVLGWSQTPAPDDALELELRSGERIGCTPNHQWPTQRGLLRADEVRVGDVIETTRLPEAEHPRRPSGLDDELVGWFVGLYMAEGSRSDKVIQFAGNINEAERLFKLRRVAEAFDGTCNMYPLAGNACTINMSGAILRGILDRYVSAGTAHTKRLTVNAWQRSDAFLHWVVMGYLDGDGHYDAKNQRYRLGFTANDEWASDLRTLAARLGASISLRRATHHGYDMDWPGWSGEWRWTSSEHWNVKPRGQVVAIRQSRARHFYDVGVHDEPHLFALASGVLTHNSKLNGLPESVTDRCRDSHEFVFHLTKQGSYFSAVDEVREPYDSATATRYALGWKERMADAERQSTGYKLGGNGTTDAGPTELNPKGKLPGSVWPLASEPLLIPDAVKDHYGLPDHFAAFPTELVRRIILGWSPSGVCVACGEGRRPVVEKSASGKPRTDHGLGGRHESDQFLGGNGGKQYIADRSEWRTGVSYDLTGYACACTDTSSPTRPAVVLDVFSGTGTTVGVARSLGRTGVGVDLSMDYCRLGHWRVFRSEHFRKANRRTNAERQGSFL